MECSYRHEFERILINQQMKKKKVTQEKNNKYNNDEKFKKVKNIK